MDRNDIKKVMKERRTELGLTMLDVSKAVGVSEATVSRWESGSIENMRLDKIGKLAKILKLSPAMLLGWNDSDNEAKEDLSKFEYMLTINFLNKIYEPLYSNLLEVLVSFFPEYPMPGLFTYKQELEKVLHITTKNIINKLFTEINLKIFSIFEQELYKNIVSLDAEINLQFIKNTITSSSKFIEKKGQEIIKSTILEYGTNEFMEEIGDVKQNSYDFPLSYDMEKINEPLIEDLSHSIQEILIEDLYINLACMIIKNNFFCLNFDGQDKAFDYISDLSEQTKYCDDKRLKILKEVLYDKKK